MAIKRDPYLDFLRFIGLSAIIFAHINGSELLTQLRCFDVPLMLFVSGLAYSGKEIGSYWDFIKRRVKRLVVPVYIFLTVFFIVSYSLYYLGLSNDILPLRKVIGSYLLLFYGSIGYVWVIKVFLMIMLVTPPMLSLGKKNKNFVGIVVVLLLILSEFIAQMLPVVRVRSEIAYFVLFETVPFMVAYSVPFLIGMQVRNSNKTFLWVFGSILLLLLSFTILYNQTGHILPISPVYKYPPRPIFIIYGVTASLLLWGCKSFFSRIADWKPFKFIGSNTIWIYLWHIPFVDLANEYISDSFVRFFVVYGGAVFVFIIQYVIVNKIFAGGDNFGKKYLIG